MPLNIWKPLYILTVYLGMVKYTVCLHVVIRARLGPFLTDILTKIRREPIDCMSFFIGSLVSCYVSHFLSSSCKLCLIRYSAYFNK